MRTPGHCEGARRTEMAASRKARTRLTPNQGQLRPPAPTTRQRPRPPRRPSKTSTSTSTNKHNNRKHYHKHHYKSHNLLKLNIFASLILHQLLLVNQVGHSALLTNIYGRKLSEIRDINGRFLLLTSPNTNSVAASNQRGRHEPAQGEALNLNTTLTTPTAPETTTTTTTTTATAHEQLHQLPESSPLIASWQQQQQQLQQQPRSAKLLALPQNNSFENNQAAAAAPEGVSTEFPNPNINNLGHEITKILRKFFQHGYDKRVRPNYSGPPALVNVSFHIIGISSVDEVQMDFTTDFYFRQKWFDPRLEFDAVGEIDELCVGAEFAERIWLPDTFFANEKTATFHKATTENTFIRIGQNGRVYRSIRLTVTCSCPMDLQYFPMDRQRCKIEIESYGYNTRDIDYRWERGDASVTLNTKIELPQFKILGFKMGQEIQNLSSGDYIRLYCEIHFVRSMGYYLFQIYIPASLIVMISWVSFWLHRNATPARVALGVTTVLTMTTLMSSTNAALPKISYIKSIDVFLGTCFVMVFAALLEYASVGYIGKRIAMKRKRLQDLQQMQLHHQKVCVAAAASAAAAAAAAAAQQQRQQQHQDLFTTGATMIKRQPEASQTLHRRSLGGLMKSMNEQGSKTLQRGSIASSMMNNSNNNNQGINDHSGDLGAQFGPTHRSSIKVLFGDNNGKSGAPFATPKPINNSGLSPLLGTPSNNNNNDAREPLLAAGAAIAAAAAANQHSHGPTTEFEVNQTHDMIRICGLTPSSIDKHSRVVFPICFVCFNLMYWIIYGHISQQIEDKGPPLIPFIKN